MVTARRVVAQHFIPPHKHHTVPEKWADLRCHCGMFGSQESLIRRWGHFLKIYNHSMCTPFHCNIIWIGLVLIPLWFPRDTKYEVLAHNSRS